jgi:hypothetical protein
VPTHTGRLVGLQRVQDAPKCSHALVAQMQQGQRGRAEGRALAGSLLNVAR